MKKRFMIICGWCYPEIKDSIPNRIVGGCQSKDRCAFCGRAVEHNAYVVEVGDEEDTSASNGKTCRMGICRSKP